MVQVIFILAALFGILTGIMTVLKNKEKIKSTLAEWTRHGIKVIYVWVSHNKETVTLNLYLCGEEKSWLFPDPCPKKRNSQILAIKTISYNPSYNSFSDREDCSEWMSQFSHPLSKEPFPALMQLVGKSKFRFGFYSDNDETIIVSDSFKFKTELSECKKKYKIKYVKKASKAIDKWKIKNRYPT